MPSKQPRDPRTDSKPPEPGLPADIRRDRRRARGVDDAGSRDGDDIERSADVEGDEDVIGGGRR